MLNKADALSVLRVFFKKNRIASLADLYSLLETTSRMSVFRRLRELNYLSSYSHVGRFYTLPAVANFDTQGLWFYEEIGFSRFGNLKATMLQLIEQSIAGKTHEELERLLHIRVHNPLLDLVRSGKITRDRFEGVFLYLSVHDKQRQKQLAHRHEGQGDDAKDLLPDGTIIEVLVEIIRCNQVQIDQHAILSRLATRGVQITASQLKQLCTRLDLKKTPDSP